MKERLCKILSQRWTLLVLGFVAGGLIVMHVFLIKERYSETLISEQRQEQGIYKFVSPLLSCEAAPVTALSNAKVFNIEKNVEAAIEKMKLSGTVSEVAVYYRGLNPGGSWFGINHEIMFTPGSLLKVPLAISIFKHAETDPGTLLHTKIDYKGGRADTLQYFTPPHTVEPGKAYTVLELVNSMLINSDNNAALLLNQFLDKEEILRSYSDLGIVRPGIGQDYEMTVRTYASFFKILYNATYLSAEASEALLSILSESIFSKGLKGGIPASVPVSHKFGERVIKNGAEAQLHDCGIIYDPGNPYVLCVMTRGRDFQKLSSAIQDISRIVYTGRH